MLQRHFTVRSAFPFIGRVLALLSLSAALGCSAPERDVVHAIPIPEGLSEAEGAGSEEERAAGPQFSLDPAVTLTVAALDPSGAPVAGADVTVLHAAALDPAALVLSSRITGDRTRTLARRATWRGRTAKDGTVAIPMAGGGGCLVAVEAGELYGEAEYRGRGGESLNIALAARRTVVVSVTNSDGTPAEGVPLTVRAEDAKGVLQALPITAITGSDGKAFLRVPAGAPPGLEVVARLAMVSPPRVSITGDAPGSMELPPMGSLEIEVQGHPTFEGPAAGVAQVFAAADGSRSRATLAVPIAGGRAIVPRVQAGIPLRVICAVADGVSPSEILASQSVPVPAVAVGEVGLVRVSFDRYQRVGRKLEPR